MEIIVDNTRLSTFKDCPRKYYYRFVKDLVLKGNQHSYKPQFGIALHEALAKWYETNDASQMDSEFINNWTDYEGLDSIRTMERGLEILDKYRKQYSTEQFSIKHIELAGAISLDNCIYVSKIDTIVNWTSWNKNYILEHKSSAHRGYICPRPNAQVEGYVVSASSLLNIPISGAIFNFMYFRKGRRNENIADTISLEREMIDIDNYTIKEWEKDCNFYANSIKNCLDANYFPKQSGTCYSYGKCPYISICEFGNPDKLDLSNSFTTEKWEPYKGAFDQ